MDLNRTFKSSLLASKCARRSNASRPIEFPRFSSKLLDLKRKTLLVGAWRSENAPRDHESVARFVKTDGRTKGSLVKKPVNSSFFRNFNQRPVSSNNPTNPTPPLIDVFWIDDRFQYQGINRAGSLSSNISFDSSTACSPGFQIMNTEGRKGSSLLALELPISTFG